MSRTHIDVTTGEAITLREMRKRLRKRTALLMAHAIPGTARLSQDAQSGSGIRSRVIGTDGRILFKEWWLA